MPSTSGRAASHPRRADKLKFFIELKELIGRCKANQEQSKLKQAPLPQNPALSDDQHSASTPETQSS